MNSEEADDGMPEGERTWGVADWAYVDLNSTDLPLVDLWLSRWEPVRHRIQEAIQVEQHGREEDGPLMEAFKDMLVDLQEEIQGGQDEFFSGLNRTSDFEVLLVWADD
jgi:hypothetical protein